MTGGSVVSLGQEVGTISQFLSSSARELESVHWQQERREMLAEVYRTDSLETFVDHLVAAFNQFGANTVDVSPDLKDLLKENHVTLGSATFILDKFVAHCQGRYIDLGKALEYLERQPYFVDLQALNMACGLPDEPNLLCDLSFVVYLREKGGTQ